MSGQNPKTFFSTIRCDPKGHNFFLPQIASLGGALAPCFNVTSGGQFICTFSTRPGLDGQMNTKLAAATTQKNNKIMKINSYQVFARRKKKLVKRGGVKVSILFLLFFLPPWMACFRVISKKEWIKTNELMEEKPGFLHGP